MYITHAPTHHRSDRFGPARRRLQSPSAFASSIPPAVLGLKPLVEPNGSPPPGVKVKREFRRVRERGERGVKSTTELGPPPG